MTVDGSKAEFPECPAAYLRMPADLPDLEDRFGGPVFAPHLEGGTHVAGLISMYASEIELGARRATSLSPLVLSLVHLYMSESASKRAHESEMRARERGH